MKKIAGITILATLGCAFITLLIVKFGFCEAMMSIGFALSVTALIILGLWLTVNDK